MPTGGSGASYGTIVLRLEADRVSSYTGGSARKDCFGGLWLC